MTSAPKGPPTEKRAAPSYSVVGIGFILLLAACSAAPAIAQTLTKNCECAFDTKDYEAYGTNGACGIFMYNKARSCEISFSGAGANTKLLKETLGELQYQKQLAVSRQIFEQYAAYESSGEKGRFLEPSFIETSLVVLERAVLFRESLVRMELPLKEIDSMFVDFSKKYSGKIATTFAGKTAPFEVKWGTVGVFSVGQGYVELRFKSSTLRVVYFSGGPR